MICTERFLKRSENDYCIYSDIVDEQRRECSMMHKIMPVHIHVIWNWPLFSVVFLQKHAHTVIYTRTHTVNT